MGKAVLVLVLLLTLTGCQQNKIAGDIKLDSHEEITTYKEVVKGSVVEIDGIIYDINSARKSTYLEYDDDGNLIKGFAIDGIVKDNDIYYDDNLAKKGLFTYDANGNNIKNVITGGDNEMRSESLYEKNMLIENKKYTNDHLLSTHYYSYKDDKLIETRMVSDSNLEVITKFSYGENSKTSTYFNTDGTISYITTESLDDDGNVINATIAKADGSITEYRTYYYEDTQLVKIITKNDEGVISRTSNYEYNNIGDRITEYNIYHGEESSLLIFVIYDYEYNANLLKKSLTTYRIQAEILNENIREY